MLKIKLFFLVFLVGLIFLIILGVYSKDLGTNIDSNSKYAWSPGIGWINFTPARGGVLVTGSELKGYAWSQSAGWINLNPSSAGVKNDGQGKLSGFAWSSSVGWINFAPQGEGIIINKDGEFEGWAWGENIGWISFNCKNTYSCVGIDYRVKTSWRPSDVKSDNIPPSTKIVPRAGKYKSIRTVTLFASDNESGSGVEGIYYAFGDSTNFVKYSKPLKITKDTVLKVYSQDRKGNKEAIKRVKYTIKKAKFATKALTNNEAKIEKKILYSANDFDFSFSLFPDKLKETKYYLEVEKINKYSPNLSNAKKVSLNKYWKVATNLNKYQIKNAQKDVFKVKLVFYYEDAEFKKLQKANKSLKKNDLKLKYYNAKNKEWKDILAEHNQKDKALSFTVNIISPKFFYPEMWFAIGK